jgi:hypothetical protein
MITSSSLTLATVAAAALVFAGCGSSKPAAEEMFIGRVDGTPALIGLATDGQRVRAYVCDSKTLAVWFDGNLREGNAELRSRDGARLALALNGDGAEGTLTVRGKAHSFIAPPVRGEAGVYRATGTTRDGRRLQADWVVLPGGRQTGGVRVPGASAPAQPAPLVDPSAATIELKGATVVVQKLVTIDELG